jgi:agmatinase
MHKTGEKWTVTRSNTTSTLQGIFCDEIDDLGPDGIASMINSRVGAAVPVYLSINLNVIDAGLAPAVSDPFVGGWTTRELTAVLRSIEELNV